MMIGQKPAMRLGYGAQVLVPEKQTARSVKLILLGLVLSPFLPG